MHDLITASRARFSSLVAVSQLKDGHVIVRISTMTTAFSFIQIVQTIEPNASSERTAQSLCATIIIIVLPTDWRQFSILFEWIIFMDLLSMEIYK